MVQDQENFRGSCLVYMKPGDYIDARFRSGAPTAPVAVHNEYGYFDVKQRPG